MGATKSSEFTTSTNRKAQLFKALGHPARIAIVEHLLEVKKCIGVEIIEELPLSYTTVFQHLRELKNVGIIKGNIEGNSICYCLDSEVMLEINEYVSAIFEKNNYNNLKCC